LASPSLPSGSSCWPPARPAASSWPSGPCCRLRAVQDGHPLAVLAHTSAGDCSMHGRLRRTQHQRKDKQSPQRAAMPAPGVTTHAWQAEEGKVCLQRTNVHRTVVPVPGRSTGNEKRPSFQSTKAAVQCSMVASVSSDASKPRMSSSAICERTPPQNAAA
jgi:hypothetical protein